MKILISVLLLCISALYGSETTRWDGVWWVFFTDRGPDLEARLSSRSIELINSPSYERRVSAGCFEVDELDLPPWPGYVEQIESVCGPSCIRVSSRYLNAVSLPSTGEDLIKIMEMPFVDHVRPVSSSTFRTPEFIGISAVTAGLTGAQLSQIHLEDLHERGWTGNGTVIGVLDSGFNLDHVVFQGIDIVLQYDFINDDDDPSQQPDDPPGQSDHGTAVLSVLGGYREGVFSGGAPDASFILAKTEDISDEYPAEEDYWVAGLEWIEENGADLVSSSLGYLQWYTYEDMDGNTAVTTIAADAAASRGMPVFNAVGNYGPGEGTLNAPADGDSVFAAGAVDAEGNVTGFSSRGPTFDGRIKPTGCALGSGVVLAYQGTTAYSSGSGTSFSTPLVTSAAAAIHQAHPEWSMIEVMNIITLTSSEYDSPDNTHGYGIIDALAALKYRSVTGSVRWSLSGQLIPEYPMILSMGDSAITINTNQSGWFAVCPGEFGDFAITSGGGPGILIPTFGTLTDEGVELAIYVDLAPGSENPSVYPNPSMGECYIGFDMLEGPADVSAAVFDITGQRIAFIARTAVGPGSFRAPLPGEAILWDGLTASGERAASGIYIILLTIGDTAHLLKCAIVH